MMSQLKFACAVHEPLQLAVHPAVQVAVGGVPLQLAWQRAPQLAWHDAVHSDMLLSDAHWPVQLPWQSAEQEPSQSNMPGWAMQLAMHPPEQLASQFALTMPVHPPVQFASRSAEHWSWKLGGVHIAMHPPEVTSMHCSLPAKSKLPHPSRTSARAVPGVSATIEPPTSEAKTVTSPKRRGMQNLPYKAKSSPQ
jgi:hypothetical protein